MKENKQQKVRQPRAAYAGFLFQTFFRRPSGFVIPCLYVVYLALILLIVPKILKVNPLFIWNVGGFNMPVFNLFFIAAAAAALAVSIFRTGREDGTELSLSSKPLTKGAMVGIKVAVYLVIMLGICVITNIITALTLPIFGLYNDKTNITGIAIDKYIGLNMSVLIGNIINMFLFGGISVLISMVGGQVATIVGSVGIVFIMCLMNFLYPQIVTSALDVLRDKYNTEIISMSCNTLDQYYNKDTSGQSTFATIQCITDSTTGEEVDHFDTREYWMKAQRQSGGVATNYVDIARQLSSLYNAFGLNESKLAEASKLSIGVNQGFRYHVLADTHVTNADNLKNKKYPLSFYTMTTKQGMQFPRTMIVGGDMSINKNNWFATSVLNQYDFASVSIVTNGNEALLLSSKEIRQEYGQTYSRIYELSLTDQQQTVALQLYNKTLEKINEDGGYKKLISPNYFEEVCHNIIVADDSGTFFEVGKFGNYTPYEQYLITSKIHFAWAIIASNKQNDEISKYCSNKDAFPFKSKTVTDWYLNNAEKQTDPYIVQQTFGEYLFKKGIQIIEPVEGKTHIQTWDRLVTTNLDYAETYSNLYKYDVTDTYNVYVIMGIWSFISIVFFAGAIIIYKKTDFK